MTEKGKKNGGTAGKGKRVASGGYSQDVTWINPQLNGTDERWLAERGDKVDSDVLRLFDDLRDHQRVTSKVDERSGRWLAILFDGALSESDGVVALSVRGATALDALIVLSYYYFVVYEQQLPAGFSSATGRFG